MEAFLDYTLIAHIICGFAALVMGLAVIIFKKSGKIHRTLGGIYFWSMTGVFVTSMVLSILKFNLFLFGVGVFSYYLVYTGFRFGRMKGYHRLEQSDKWIFIFSIICSIGMLGYSVYAYIIYQSMLVIVLAVFGTLLLQYSIQDLINFGKRKEKNNWLIVHIKRMLGGYTATMTAFLITAMSGMLPPLVLWLGPGVIGGVGISLTVRHYKKKWGTTKKKSDPKTV